MKRISSIALLSLILSVGFSLFASTTSAQTKKTPAKKSKTTTKPVGKFTILPSGLEYKIVKHGKGTRKPQLNDHIEMNINVHVKDSVIFDSRKMYNNKPVPLPISKPKFKGDVMEGFMMMVAGDSIVFRLPVDSLKKTKNQVLPFMKSGDYIEYDVNLVSVKTDSEAKKDAEEKMAAQKIIDEKTLQEYFTKHNIKPLKSATGIYYTISRQGEGPLPKTGQTISVNYTGTLLGGKTFDSNTDSSFKHVKPFELEIGKGKVIKGWDEGLVLFNKGTKATIYIPSSLGYGSQDRSPSIPPNSILVFDVEIVDIQEQVNQADKDDKAIREYLQKNNINASKTASGLYYVITKEGTGENPAAGDKVSVMYTGKLIDGTVFDSNEGRSPLNFALGKGQVIKGWDEGIQLLKKGTKATLFLPSGIAYGARKQAKIPANSILIFDVELTDFSK